MAPRYTGSALLLILLSGSSASGQAFTSRAPVVDPIYGPGYGYGWWHWGGFGDYLHGSADVIRAQAKFMVDQQKALLLREEVRRSKLVTRRKHIEQWLWERETIPSLEEERERRQRLELRRSRNDPPLTEIWSAEALNNLLLNSIKSRPSGDPAGSTPLSADIVDRINVTSGKGGNIGLLREQPIRWPLLLRRSEFAADRDRLNQLAADAVAVAAKGEDIPPEILGEMLTRLEALQKQVSAVAGTWSQQPGWTPTLYMDAKSFLNQFDASARVLQQPEAGRYLGGKYTARGKTVAELVQNMKESGMLFAPASPGNEAAYTALYRALREYDVAGQPPAPPK